jgi:F0F1-type ATP synthase membrane subunit c/vacuolar-type H+-ATPase subunit K
MKLRIPKRQAGTSGAEAFLAHLCVAFDRSIPGLRTGFLITGLIAAAMRTGELADFLFVTGLLFQFAIWFEQWWCARRSL